MGGEAKRRKAWVEQGGEDWGRKGARGSGTARRQAWREHDRRAALEGARHAAVVAKDAGASDDQAKDAMIKGAQQAVERNVAVRRAGRNRVLVQRRRQGAR